MRKFVSQIITLPFLLAVLSLMLVNNATAAEWRVQKMSGDVWVETNKPTKVALTKNTIFKNGDKIKTGDNGRVLLKRNKETILVSPNSVIGLPEQAAKPGKTIILQQMGEILLDVEKRNVKHFEVSTPYLAAVVKGTQFSVTVDETGSNVKVLRGKVEVANLRTGQFVLVKPGQSAHIETSKNNSPASGLILKGTGEKEKIQKGSAKKQRVKPLKTNQFRKLKQNQANKTKLKSSKIKKAASKSIRGKIKNSKIKLGSKPLKQFRKNKITKTRHKKYV